MWFFSITSILLQKKNLNKMRVNLNYLASWHDILEVSPNYISKKDQLKLEQYISSIENGK